MGEINDYTIFLWHYRFQSDGRQITRDCLPFHAMAIDTVMQAIEDMRPQLKHRYANPLFDDIIAAVRCSDCNILYWEAL